MSLYRKYRPQNFANLVGQEHVRITLSNALKLARVNHAYLFTGPRGTGKTSTARILAKAINCLNLKDAQPCEECDICRDISEGRLIDVIEIDAASNGRIEEIRDLREKINFAPTRARSKVYIIDEVHMVTKDAFNALLKTLEEPPTHVYFILATTEVHKIPETILSRCQRFDFKRIEDETLVARLSYIAAEEKIETEVKALEAIAHQAQGGMRDAIGLLEQLTVENKLTFAHVIDILGISGYASIEKLFGFLLQKDAQSGLAEIHNLYAEGYDLVQFNKNFLEYLRKKMLKSVEAGLIADTVWILKIIGFFQEAYEQVRFATITQLPLEIATIRSCLPNSLPVGSGTKNAEAVGDAVGTGKTAASATAMDKAAVEARNMAGNVVGAVAGPGKVSVVESTEAGRVGQSGLQSKIVEVGSQTVPNSVENAPAKEEARIHQGLNTTLNAGRIVTFEEFKSKWPRIGEHLKIPAAKRSFQGASLLKVENNIVTLAFATKFHLEKMMETENRIELERSLETIFEVNLKVVAELKTLANLAKEISKADGNLTERSADDSLADQVAAMFEGEVV